MGAKRRNGERQRKNRRIKPKLQKKKVFFEYPLDANLTTKEYRFIDMSTSYYTENYCLA